MHSFVYEIWYSKHICERKKNLPEVTCSIWKDTSMYDLTAVSPF